MTRKYYLIKLVANDGHESELWLRKDKRTFKWNNHGQDKEYKNLGSAKRQAHALALGLRKMNDMRSIIAVVEVTFKPCNPQLPDGFYEPVKTTVATF